MAKLLAESQGVRVEQSIGPLTPTNAALFISRPEIGT